MHVRGAVPCCMHVLLCESLAPMRPSSSNMRNTSHISRRLRDCFRVWIIIKRWAGPNLTNATTSPLVRLKTGIVCGQCYLRPKVKKKKQIFVLVFWVFPMDSLCSANPASALSLRWFIGSLCVTASETLQAEAKQAKPVQERCEPEVVAITSMQKQPLVHHH